VDPASYGGSVTSQTAAEPAAPPTEAPTWDVVHGYPPPAQPAGAIVIAYCGEPMIVRGECSASPPLDTCADCIAIWRHHRAHC
jgi:hypothetical protein